MFLDNRLCIRVAWNSQSPVCFPGLKLKAGDPTWLFPGFVRQDHCISQAELEFMDILLPQLLGSPDGGHASKPYASRASGRCRCAFRVCAVVCCAGSGRARPGSSAATGRGSCREPVGPEAAVRCACGYPQVCILRQRAAG